MDLPAKAHGSDGGQSKANKVIRHAKLVRSENLGRNFPETALPFRFRQDIFPRHGEIQSLQGKVVHLIPLVARQGLRINKVIRHHVFRQDALPVGVKV